MKMTFKDLRRCYDKGFNLSEEVIEKVNNGEVVERVHHGFIHLETFRIVSIDKELEYERKAKNSVRAFEITVESLASKEREKALGVL